MKPSHLIVAALLASFMPAIASAQDRTIDGKAVPAGQATAVQDRCAELRAQQGTTGSQEPEASLDQKQEEAATGDGGNVPLDVTTITLQQCIDGGFLEQPSNASPNTQQ